MQGWHRSRRRSRRWKTRGLPATGSRWPGSARADAWRWNIGARNPGLAGVFGLSAGLVGTADAGGAPDPALYGFADKRLDYDGDLTGTPVTITVHEADPHIPLKRARDSAAAFRAMGADAGLEITPGAGHGITQAGVTRLRAVLNR
jgi:predicted esterase